ncbi:putative ras [Diplogelasinospora grovesii]|uniref:Ras n=1 Tax=Diplogelasinospora grovesii TaxID=303347 RepID=A0AAN6NC01_9PEZI|nr:putative ras [Diplogelasinospora grovesii]
MKMAQPAKLRSLYRALLRELPPRPVLKSPRSPLHSRLRESFQSSSTSDSVVKLDTEHGVSQAEQYLAYLQAQRTYVTLLERYNPGMGMDEEERVRLSARRVGMNMPVEFGKDSKL